MEQMNLLKADLLDIIFEGRNKAYGAYQLRKTYDKRLGTALLITGLAIVAALLPGILRKNSSQVPIFPSEIPEITLITQALPKVVIPETVSVPKQAAVPNVKVEQYTNFDIIKDHLVDESVKAPEMNDLEKAIIGAYKADGVDLADGQLPPPSKGGGTGLVVGPKTPDLIIDTIFTKVEFPAEFPGGLNAWRRYLESNLNYPEIAIENETQGVIKVQFVVDREGRISEVQALNKVGDGIEEEAIRIIQKGPRWKPAEQNGRKVIYRHVQGISFKLN